MNPKEKTKFLGKPYTNWIEISKHPNLKENFIRKYKDKLNWTYLLEYQDLSDDFKEEMKDYINKRPPKKQFKFFK